MSQNNYPEPRRVRPGRANDWIRDAWGQFKRAPLEWGLVLMACLVLNLVLSFIPAGPILSTLVQPMLIGAIMLGCHAGSRQAQGLDIKAMKTVLESPHSGNLLLLGLLSLVGVVIAVIPLALLLSYALAGQAGAAASEPSLLLPFGLLICLLPSLLLFAALWYAPALVVVSGCKPVAALQASARACWRNPLALLLYGLWILGLSALVLFTFGLGLVIALPLVFASLFASFEDIFDVRRRPPQDDAAGVLEA